MYALESLHYRVTEQLTHRFVHSFCGNVACGGGNNTNLPIIYRRCPAWSSWTMLASGPSYTVSTSIISGFFQLVDAGRKSKTQGSDFFQDLAIERRNIHDKLIGCENISIGVFVRVDAERDAPSRRSQKMLR